MSKLRQEGWIVYGAGRRGKNYASALLRAGKPVVALCDTYKMGWAFLDAGKVLPIISYEELQKRDCRVVVAIANDEERQKVTSRLQESGIKTVAFEDALKYDPEVFSSLEDVLELCSFVGKGKNPLGIRFEDISVVVQGAVDPHLTPICLESIRRFLPGSTIILSTWEGSETGSLDADLLVTSKDPGGFNNVKHYPYDSEKANNANRQLVSTQAGLEKVTTRYTLKIRTDMILTSDILLDSFSELEDSFEGYRIFGKKLLVADTNTKHSYKDYPYLFHVSDWFFFGYSEDVKKYFLGTEPASKEELSDYCSLVKPEVKEATSYAYNVSFDPEQYYAVCAAKRAGFENLPGDWTDTDDEKNLISEKFILSNFVPLNFSRHGILLPKYMGMEFVTDDKINKFAEGLLLYKRYKMLVDVVFRGAKEDRGILAAKRFAEDDAVIIEKAFPHDDYAEKTINYKDISVVVQGKVDPDFTPYCIKSIRKYLPGSKIILSTWAGENTDALEADVVVKSKDPGEVRNGILQDFDHDYVNNTNRQLLSLKSGLEQADTEYTLKLRSDMYLTTNDFLRYFEESEEPAGSYRLFSHRILIGNIYTRNSVQKNCRMMPVLFHPSDIFAFGRTEDLRKLYEETPLMKVEEMNSYSEFAHPERKTEYKCHWNARYLPEQYYAMELIKRSGLDISFHDWTDWNDRNTDQSQEFIKSNFRVLDFTMHGMVLFKYIEDYLENTKAQGNSIEGLYPCD